ncbi:MAG: hypothetical protein Q7T69_04230 [Rhodoferax sp.]|nr:hypothetical protein [Rhodoferax sp.]
MHNAAIHTRSSRQFAHTVRQPLEKSPACEQLANESRMDRQFMALLDAYRNTGGLARAQEVFTMYRSRHGADVETLARWIVRREVISFDWQSKVWVPLFQFDRTTMTLQPGLNSILAALNPIHGPQEMAAWFAQPSRWLMEQAPADVFGTDPHAVLKAACTDRFIAA